MRVIKAILVASLLALGLHLYMVNEKDELVCQIASEGKFYLVHRFHYSWLISYLFGPIHARLRYDESPGFEVYFKDKNSVFAGDSIHRFNGTSAVNIQDHESRVSSCANFRQLGDYVSVGRYGFLDKNRVFRDVGLSLLTRPNTYPDSEALEKLGFYDSSLATTAPVDEAIVFESLLTDGFVGAVNFVREGEKHREKKVLAVLQSKSLDDGRTWSPIIITTKSHFYTVGSTVSEQKGYANPVSFYKGPR